MLWHFGPITFEKQGTEELEIGSEVETSNGEQFYVIGGDTVGTAISNSTQDILLLTKYNLKEEKGILMQDKNGATNPCAFSSIAYWSSVSGIAYPDADGKYPDLNDVEKYPIGSETSVITTEQKYGSDLGVTGRLMTYKEASALEEKHSDILYGYEKNTEKGYLSYWLSSAMNEDYVWNANGGSVPLLRCRF